MEHLAHKRWKAWRGSIIRVKFSGSQFPDSPNLKSIFKRQPKIAFGDLALNYKCPFQSLYWDLKPGTMHSLWKFWVKSGECGRFPWMEHILEKGSHGTSQEILVPVKDWGLVMATSLTAHPENHRRSWAYKAITWKGQLSQSKADLSLVESRWGRRMFSNQGSTDR